jgi:orotate phosphoribosyltransferase-like protein
MNLFEDGFKTKEDQIVILNRQGLSVEQIAEKANVSKDKVTSILSSNQNQSKNKINE